MRHIFYSRLKETLLIVFLLLFTISLTEIRAQNLTQKVNVFLGSSGDHGQLSPGASSPFHQMNIAPQTYPHLHMGYEYLAKEILGFTHNRFEGTGCQGSGGLILVKPYLENEKITLEKIRDNAGPGFYEIDLKEGLSAKFTVFENMGIHEYNFPKGTKGLHFELDHSFNNAFVSNEYEISKDNILTGEIKSKTTCHAGTYTIFYAIQLPVGNISTNKNHINIQFNDEVKNVWIKVSFSSVDKAAALSTLKKYENESYATLKNKSQNKWEEYLSAVSVKGNEELQQLFYSLLYRTMQSPFLISEKDGRYRGTDGNIHQSNSNRYHGWAIWDNYKTQLPLLALIFPNQYQDIVYSIGDLYRYGKYDFAGPSEPANTVRTEHAAVVILDALYKGYVIDLRNLKDSLVKDTARFDFSKPDKYLEAAYDMWAMGLLFSSDKKHYLDRAETYKTVWQREFQDLSKPDVDRMSARGMYQGTIRQYRWNVPFDVKGLVELCGGEKSFTAQLDEFFNNHYFNRANEPDMQSPTLYYASSKPWRYQSLIHELALDTVIQYYFNNNSRGIDPFIDRIYKNEPKAFIKTMDDDAGAMSAWFILSALGLQQPLIGESVYYLSVPFFEEITFNKRRNPFKISVKNFDKNNRYIYQVLLNGKDINRLWITHHEILEGGNLEIVAGDKPSEYGTKNRWISDY